MGQREYPHQQRRAKQKIADVRDGLSDRQQHKIAILQQFIRQFSDSIIRGWHGCFFGHGPVLLYAYLSSCFFIKTSRTVGGANSLPITCRRLIARSARSGLTSSAKVQMPTTSIFRRLPFARVFSRSARL